MKKKPEEKKKTDEYTRLTIRNWIIFAVALMLTLFCMYVLPLILEYVNNQ